MKETAKLRPAIMKINCKTAQGKVIIGDKVFIKEEFMGHSRYSFTASLKEDGKDGFHVTQSQFEFSDEETYSVHVTRKSYAHKIIVVKAKTRAEASQLANEKAGDLVFSESSADYEVDSILTELEQKNLFK